MKIKTLFGIILLSVFSLNLTNCAPKIGETAASVEEAEAILAKQAKKKHRQGKKAQKEAYKRYWSQQSKEAKKSVKRNMKKQKKAAKRKG